MDQRSFFDVEDALQSLSKMGDPLERLAAAIPRESFRPLPVKVHGKERKSNAGRKPIDVVLIFKVLILQTPYNLADEQVEYQIRDRLSFARFLGLRIEDSVPDATTVWNFRERLKELELLEALFDRFGDYLAAEGYQAKQRQIVDASIIPAAIQGNSREENHRIKAGRSRKTGVRASPSRKTSRRVGRRRTPRATSATRTTSTSTPSTSSFAPSQSPQRMCTRAKCSTI